MGAGGGQTLILAFVLAWVIGADPVGLHLEPVLAAPSLSARLDSLFRDSLRARGVDLFSLDSLRRLQVRGEWPAGEKSPANLAKMKALSKRATIGWVRVDLPNPEFKRMKWFPLWAKREWVLRGEIFRSSGEGLPAVERFSLRQELPLGFVGTWDADQFPPSSADVRKALDVLSAEAAGRIANFLTATPAP